MKKDRAGRDKLDHYTSRTMQGYWCRGVGAGGGGGLEGAEPAQHFCWGGARSVFEPPSSRNPNLQTLLGFRGGFLKTGWGMRREYFKVPSGIQISRNEYFSPYFTHLLAQVGGGGSSPCSNLKGSYPTAYTRGLIP